MDTRALEVVVSFGVLTAGQVIHVDPKAPSIAALIGQGLLRYAPWAQVPDEETLVDATVVRTFADGEDTVTIGVRPVTGKRRTRKAADDGAAAPEQA